MAFVDTLTDAEIDRILARYDATDPKLQRRILAQAVWRGAAVTEFHDAIEAIVPFVAEDFPGGDPDAEGVASPSYRAAYKKLLAAQSNFTKKSR